MVMIDTFFIDEKIKTRGEDYYKSGKVKLVFQGLNSFKTIVSGKQKYICELTLKDGDVSTLLNTLNESFLILSCSRDIKYFKILNIK